MDSDDSGDTVECSHFDYVYIFNKACLKNSGNLVVVVVGSVNKSNRFASG